MEDDIFFNKFVTKDLHPIGGDQRFFEGYLTVQVKDKQGEITIVDELIKVLPIWMDRGAPISDTHSNRIIGKGISYAKTVYKSAEGDEYPAIKITGKIHKDYHLDDEIWGKIKSGEYKGLSFGGATKANRTPKIMKDGSVAYELKSLEHYEVAVCKDPAVPLALITDYNPLAKAITDNVETREDGKMVIKCDKFGCTVAKGEDFSNADGDRTNMYNQDVNPDGSSNRRSNPTKDDGETEIKVEDDKKEDDEEDKKKSSDCPNCKISQKKIAERGMVGMGGACPNCGHGFKDPRKPKDDEEVSKDANLHYGGIRHSGKEYDTNNESAQITQVKEEKKDDEEEEKEDDDKKKSGAITEAGNNQLGGQGAPSENYINSEKEQSDKDMEEKDSNKEYKDEKDEKSSDDDKDEIEKSDFQESIKSNMSTLTDVIKSLAETQKDVSHTLGSIEDRLKALETPTDLPLKPSVSATEDVGAKVTIPDTYQSNSVQAGLDDDKSGEDKPKTDPSGLKMQEKANFDFTTETPRPNAAIETINKSETDMSFVLKDAREGGNLSVVARNILAGKYYTPTPDEVGTY